MSTDNPIREELQRLSKAAKQAIEKYNNQAALTDKDGKVINHGFFSFLRHRHAQPGKKWDAPSKSTKVTKLQEMIKHLDSFLAREDCEITTKQLRGVYRAFMEFLTITQDHEANNHSLSRYLITELKKGRREGPETNQLPAEPDWTAADPKSKHAYNKASYLPQYIYVYSDKGDPYIKGDQAQNAENAANAWASNVYKKTGTSFDGGNTCKASSSDFYVVTHHAQRYYYNYFKIDLNALNGNDIVKNIQLVAKGNGNFHVEIEWTDEHREEDAREALQNAAELQTEARTNENVQDDLINLTRVLPVPSTSSSLTA